MVLSRQRPATASGVTFFSIEDETGVANLVVLPDVFERHDHVARHARIVLAHGKLERTPRDPRDPATPVIHVLVRSLERLDGQRAPAVRARDFR
jgi:error-prone DNA polymerase